jgi:hypothetical protein
MSMRKKPDTRSFEIAKDPSAFLDGGVAEHQALPVSASTTVSTNPIKTGQPKLTKIFNLSPELVQALKKEAFERSTNEGRRVTETELVDSALRQYLNI